MWVKNPPISRVMSYETNSLIYLIVGRTHSLLQAKQFALAHHQKTPAKNLPASSCMLYLGLILPAYAAAVFESKVTALRFLAKARIPPSAIDKKAANTT